MSKYIKNFRFFCQKVLPLVYDDSLSYYEVLCKAINKLNEIGGITNINSDSIENLGERYADLSNKVDGLIDNLVNVITPWDSSIVYRIFSIVEYQGTNYIAIQDVPIGVMITNTDYWEPANTVIEQINAIGVSVDELKEEKVSHNEIALGAQRPSMMCSYMVRGRAKMIELVGQENYDAGFMSIQASCYIPTTDNIMISVIKGSTGEAILALIDPSDYSLIRRSGIMALGHCNDMTYNPDTNTVFIATGDNGDYVGYIVELTPNMTIENTHFIGVTNWCISYDSIEKKYYVIHDPIGFRVYNSSFALLYETTFDKKYVGDGSMRIQGSIFLNGIFNVMTFTEYEYKAGYTGGYILSVDTQGNVINSMHYPLMDGEDEPEAIFEMNNRLYIVSGQSWFKIYEMAKDGSDTLENLIDFSCNRRTLADGTDLNTVFIVGIYSTTGYAHTRTLINEPTGGFSAITLKVETVGWFNIKQTVYGAYGNSWIREYNTSTSTWGEWRKNCDRSEIESFSTAVEVPSATSTLMHTFTIPQKKAAIIDVTVSFPTDATGRRMLSINGEWVQSIAAVDGDATRLSATKLIDNNATTDKNVQVRVYQNSGNSLSVTPNINFMTF